MFELNFEIIIRSASGRTARQKQLVSGGRQLSVLQICAHCADTALSGFVIYFAIASVTLISPLMIFFRESSTFARMSEEISDLLCSSIA